MANSVLTLFTRGKQRHLCGTFAKKSNPLVFLLINQRCSSPNKTLGCANIGVSNCATQLCNWIFDKLAHRVTNIGVINIGVTNIGVTNCENVFSQLPHMRRCYSTWRAHTLSCLSHINDCVKPIWGLPILGSQIFWLAIPITPLGKSTPALDREFNLR